MPTVLEPAEWVPRARAHTARVDVWVQPHLARRRTGEKHPVEDFLFDYYHLSPAKLRRWHPGAGVVLGGPEAAAYLDLADYRQVTGGVTVDRDRLARHGRRLHDVRRLLVATASRPASYGCFGLHEWAMVYRQPADQVRHAGHRLRLGSAGPTPSSRPGRCGAPTSTRTGSSPRRRSPSTRCSPPGTPRSSWSSRAASMPGWTSTSGPRPSTRSCRPSSRPTASRTPGRSARSTCARRRTTSPTSATRRSRWRPRTAGPTTSATSAPSPTAAPSCAPAWSTALDALLGLLGETPGDGDGRPPARGDRPSGASGAL